MFRNSYLPRVRGKQTKHDRDARAGCQESQRRPFIEGGKQLCLFGPLWHAAINPSQVACTGCRLAQSMKGWRSCPRGRNDPLRNRGSFLGREPESNRKRRHLPRDMTPRRGPPCARRRGSDLNWSVPVLYLGAVSLAQREKRKRGKKIWAAFDETKGPPR